MREKKVISLRFGLEDGRPRALEEVGHEFHLTRQRVRQVEARALGKLRNFQNSQQLAVYLN